MPPEIGSGKEEVQGFGFLWLIHIVLGCGMLTP
jgi:hypothetical protein